MMEENMIIVMLIVLLVLAMFGFLTMAAIWDEERKKQMKIFEESQRIIFLIEEKEIEKVDEYEIKNIIKETNKKIKKLEEEIKREDMEWISVLNEKIKESSKVLTKFITLEQHEKEKIKPQILNMISNIGLEVMNKKASKKENVKNIKKFEEKIRKINEL